MKKVLFFAALIAMASFAFAGSAKADTCPASSVCAGGVVYTFSVGENDGGGVFDVTMVVDPTNATSTATMTAFSIQFDNNKQLVTLESGPGGFQGLGLGTSTGQGTCNTNGNPNHYCFGNGSLTIGPGNGPYTFVFDVQTSGSAPTFADIQTLQGTDLAISVGTDITGPPTNTPEPASMLLLGLGLAGAPFLRRRKS